jgi:predicted RNA binding protein YcfA (HicA-like mRNA interferase family)
MASPVRFSEVKRLLERHGWSLARVTSSHHLFKKPGDRDWSIPVHNNKVKGEYVRQIKKHIGES